MMWYSIPLRSLVWFVCSFSKILWLCQHHRYSRSKNSHYSQYNNSNHSRCRYTYKLRIDIYTCILTSRRVDGSEIFTVVSANLLHHVLDVERSLLFWYLLPLWYQIPNFYDTTDLMIYIFHIYHYFTYLFTK